MKAVSVVVLCVLLVSSSSGQITVPYSAISAMFSAGGLIRFYGDSVHTGPVNVGHKGGPQTFDFSGFTFFDQGTDTIRTVTADSFTSGRYDPSGITFKIGLNQPKVEQPVLTIQTGSMNQIGKVDHYKTDSVRIRHTSPGEPFLKFPVTLGDSVQVTGTKTDSTFIGSSFSGPPSSQSFTQAIVVDGYGTLLLPGGKSYPCLRLRGVEQPPSNGKEFRYITQSGGILFVSSYNTEPDTGFVTLQDGVQYVVNPTITSVERTIAVPHTMSLEQNYPNPFNPSTVITYELPERSSIRLSIIDILGREVAVLANGESGAGFHSLTWNASDQPSGVYFSRLEAGGTVQTRKLVLLK